MATPAQIAANRLNAQKSTGPRTPEGKEASRLNALKHGLDSASIVIPGEDSAAYEALAADYDDEFDPQSAVERFQVDTLIRCDWQRRRLQRVEAKLYRALLAEGASPEDLDVAILRDSSTAKLLRKVFSQIASLDRAYSRVLNDLRRIQSQREQYETQFAAAQLDAGAPKVPEPTQPLAPEKLASFPQKPAASLAGYRVPRIV